MNPWLSKLIGKSQLIDKAVDIADRFIDTPEEKKDFIKEAYQAEVQDRNTARQAGRDKAAPEILSYITLLLAIGLGLALFTDVVNWSNLTEVQKGLMQTFLGVFLAKLNDIYGYWFGSSMGSHLKDKKNKI